MILVPQGIMRIRDELARLHNQILRLGMEKMAQHIYDAISAINYLKAKLDERPFEGNDYY